MSFFKGKRKQLAILLLCAVLLTAATALGKNFLRTLEGSDGPVVDCEVTPSGVDTTTRSLLLDITVTLQDWEKNPGVMAKIGEDDVAAPLTETADGVFTASLALPLEPINGFQLYLTKETLGHALIQEPLGRWNQITMLLPVRLQKYWLTVPRFEAKALGAGVLTTQAEEIHLEGAEDGSCAVELRVYRKGTMAQAVVGEWDAKSGLYHTKPLELPCELGDDLRLSIACRGDDGLEYEFTVGRWEITTSGDVRETPDLEQDFTPSLTWPQDGNLVE